MKTEEDVTNQTAADVRKEVARLFKEAKRFDALGDALYAFREDEEFQKMFFNPPADDPRETKWQASILISDIRNGLLELRTLRNILTGLLELAKKQHPDLVTE